ncbi:MAG: EamA family transporter [Gemmatimonadetes bacterium]|nr:DMT family transporter [Gemmatimonadota bacterium]NIR78467.1 DMT family transporter [Gemmatimonadota bacterium]NIT87077.1 DMT family transporter [Gemmatimonadota bacterium]NIU30916.1 DMT family transporter [Gemmatimonadota bacterium]NIU35679.1 EamA family transporter [Gemmatimonadota bacterium]
MSSRPPIPPALALVAAVVAISWSAPLSGAVLLSPGVPVTGYPAGDWLIFLVLAAGPMMLGHTGVNYALRYMPAYVADLPILIEPVGATLIAWALPGIREVPPLRTLAGGVVVLVGIALATGGGGADRPEGETRAGPQP